MGRTEPLAGSLVHGFGVEDAPRWVGDASGLDGTE